jgi:hypothetical protein
VWWRRGSGTIASALNAFRGGGTLAAPRWNNAPTALRGGELRPSLTIGLNQLRTKLSDALARAMRLTKAVAKRIQSTFVMRHHPFKLSMACNEAEADKRQFRLFSLRCGNQKASMWHRRCCGRLRFRPCDERQPRLAALPEPAHRQTRVRRWAVPGGWLKLEMSPSRATDPNRNFPVGESFLTGKQKARTSYGSPRG